MELIKDYFLVQLFGARATEENMKSLAIYIRTFKDYYAVVVEGIEYVYERSSMHHRLVLLYLINEILQTEKSQSGVPLKSELKKFLRKHFIKDKERSINSQGIYKRMSELQKIWAERDVIDFDDKYNLEEIVATTYQLFNDKPKLVEYFESVCKYYRNKN